MARTRRAFVRDSLVAVGGLGLGPLGCSWSNGQSTPEASPAGEITASPSYLELERSGALALIERELWQMLGSCRLCPRQCGADRLAGETGYCSSTAELVFASAMAHFGEEAPLVGNGGSGTLFFSNCNLLCCFCQNWQINHRGDGEVISHRRLAELMLGLQERGCHNLNLVTPSHVMPHVIKALRLAIPLGVRLPLVYNTGGYDSLEVVEKLDGVVDIYLPDFKYQDGELAATYSSGASDYPEMAAAVIREMHRQVGRLTLDDRGVATRGLIIRHLVMPANIAGTDRLVDWVATELGSDTCVNLMSQYRPEHLAFDHPAIARRITTEEWQQARRWAREAGLTNLI